MKYLLAAVFLCLTFGCAPRLYLPIHPAVIQCTGKNANYVVGAIAKSYNMKVSFAEGFDTAKAGTLGGGEFSTEGVSLGRLLAVLSNPDLEFRIYKRIIIVFRPDSFVPYTYPNERRIFNKH